MSLTVSLHLKSVLLSTSAHTATMQSGIRKVKLYPLKEEGRIALHFTVSLSLSLSLSLSTAFKCKNCSCTCHNYCKRHMPSNCGTLSLIGGGRQQLTTPIPEAVCNELFTNHDSI